MRVLILSDFFQPLTGGVETHVAQLSAGLVARGHEVAVFTSQVDPAPDLEVEGDVRVVRAPSAARRIPGAHGSDARPWLPPFPDPVTLAHLRRFIRSFRPEIIHGHDWIARSYLPLAIRGRSALVTTLHYYTQSCAKKNLVYRGNECSGPGVRKCLCCAGRHYGRVKGAIVAGTNWPFGRLERSQSDVTIAVSEAVARGNGYASSNSGVQVIPNFLAPAPSLNADEQRLLATLPAEPFVLFAGDLRREKGVTVLLEAYRSLAHRPPLVLIGETWPDTPADLPPGAIHLGTWPHAAVREAWSRSLFGVVPSIWPEPFGLVALECMAADRPVVASRVGGLPEVVLDGETGMLVAPGDSTALAAAMASLLADNNLRETLGRGAADRAASFSAEAILPRIDAAYELAASRRGGTTGTQTSGYTAGNHA